MEMTTARLASWVEMYLKNGSEYSPTLEEATVAAREGRLWLVDTGLDGEDCLYEADEAHVALENVAGCYLGGDSTAASYPLAWAMARGWKAQPVILAGSLDRERVKLAVADALDAAHRLDDEFRAMLEAGYGLSPERQALWQQVRGGLDAARDSLIDSK